jgi:hypothetical protein
VQQSRVPVAQFKSPIRQTLEGIHAQAGVCKQHLPGPHRQGPMLVPRNHPPAVALKATVEGSSWYPEDALHSVPSNSAPKGGQWRAGNPLLGPALCPYGCTMSFMGGLQEGGGEAKTQARERSTKRGRHGNLRSCFKCRTSTPEQLQKRTAFTKFSLLHGSLLSSREHSFSTLSVFRLGKANGRRSVVTFLSHVP